MPTPDASTPMTLEDADRALQEFAEEDRRCFLRNSRFQKSCGYLMVIGFLVGLFFESASASQLLFLCWGFAILAGAYAERARILVGDEGPEFFIQEIPRLRLVELLAQCLAVLGMVWSFDFQWWAVAIGGALLPLLVWESRRLRTRRRKQPASLAGA